MNALRYRILLFILALAPLGAWGEDLTITTETELRNFVSNVNNGNNYEGFTVYLANDIELAGGAWTPIGTSEKPFKGHFEGWGHKISGLNVSGSSNDYQGLFGYVQGGSIRDVAVTSVSITGKDHVGGICGYLDGGEISSCYCEASVSGTNNVGGICGTSSGTIKDCYMTSTIAGTTNVGGILGEQTGGEVSKCYLSGTVNGSGVAYHGSIMGKHTGGVCSNCVYPTGSSYYAIGGETTSTDSGTNVTNVKSGDLNTKSTWSGVLDPNTNTWKIEQGEAPKLYSFQKNEPITFSFSEEGDHWQTIVPNGNYKVPDDMRAYVVQGVSELAQADYGRSGTVTLHRVTTLNEGRGAIVYFHAYESDFNPIEGQSDDIVTRIAQPTEGQLDQSYDFDTWLKGSHVSSVAIGGESAYEDYILAYKELYGFAFYRARSGQLPRGKAFIRLNATANGSRLSIVIEGETTPVGEITINSDGTAIFDLYGHRLPSAPSHGLYMQNGKKIWRR